MVICLSGRCPFSYTNWRQASWSTRFSCTCTFKDKGSRPPQWEPCSRGRQKIAHGKQNRTRYVDTVLVTVHDLPVELHSHGLVIGQCVLVPGKRMSELARLHLERRGAHVTFLSRRPKAPRSTASQKNVYWKNTDRFGGDQSPVSHNTAHATLSSSPELHMLSESGRGRQRNGYPWAQKHTNHDCPTCTMNGEIVCCGLTPSLSRSRPLFLPPSLSLSLAHAVPIPLPLRL